MRFLGRAAMAAGCLYLLTSTSIGQELVPMTELQMSYAKATADLLTLWDEKELKLERLAFDKEFEARYEGFLARKSANPVEQAVSSDFVSQNRKVLPEVITPEIPLSVGAKLSLIASVVDAAAELKERGVEASAAGLQQGLPFALYATLGAAQEDAKTSGNDAIEATNIRRGGIWFFSMGWPFCCAAAEN